MRTMRLAAVAMAALLVTAGAVEAQQRGEGRRMGPGREGRMMGPWAGMGMRGPQLSEAERSAMNSVREKYRPMIQAAREALRPHMEAQREARMRGDTVAFRQALTRSASDRQRLATLQAQMAVELRAALSPETRARMDCVRAQRRRP